MKNGLLLASVVAGALFIAGCAAPSPTGALYTGIKAPVGGDSVKYSKEGRSTCKSFLGLVAIGDCSVEAAAKAGSITNVKVVDQEVSNILGLYGQYTTVVKGD